jgi:maltokinase
VHGDYHVGQLLHGPHGLAVVDFEGEPTRPLAERRALASPLRDLAGLLRSYDHLARMVLRHRGDRPEELAPAAAWVARCRAGVLAAYRAGIEGSSLALDLALLDAFEVEKETYEFVYAATFLPDWLYAPRAAMRALLATAGPA